MEKAIKTCPIDTEEELEFVLFYFCVPGITATLSPKIHPNIYFDKVPQLCGVCAPAKVILAEIFCSRFLLEFLWHRLFVLSSSFCVSPCLPVV